MAAPGSWLDLSPANRQLRKDPALQPIIKRTKVTRIRLNTRRFETLADAILSQQISAAAARSVRRKLLLAAGTLSAANLDRLSDAEIRAAGVSPQKLGYLRDLIVKTLAGDLQFRQYHRWDDRRVVEDLIQVKGVGHWTAQMFLIFSLGRPDVLPVGDLGVKTAIRNLYGLADLPNVEQMHEIAEPWRPYASIGSWYCWRSLENSP